jgi:photosystem II stability/assembly factor-like uncharacterized protein
MKIYISILFCLFQFISISQQTWIDISKADKPYDQIIDEIDAMFEKNGTGRGSGFKQYKRWRHRTDPLVTDNSIRTNFSLRNHDAYQGLIKRMDKDSPSTRATNGDWESLGPWDYTGFDSFSGGGMGRVICMAFDPQNSSVYYAGTAAGGLWKSTDSGGDWTPLTDGFSSIGISDIEIDPTDSNIMYILTGDARAYDCRSIGIMKSIDGGTTWENTGFDVDITEEIYGFNLTLDPSNSNTIYASMRDKGLLKSLDGGESWDTMIFSTTVFEVEFIPGDSNIALAPAANGLWRTIDGGLTWNLDNDPSFPATFERMDVAVCPSYPSLVYTIFNGATSIDGTFFGCYRSLNYGESFVMASNSPNIFGWELDGNDSDDQGSRDLAFIVDPTNENTIFAGGVNIWKSTTLGQTWGRETWRTRNYQPSDPFVHADQQNFYWHQGSLFTCNDGGIFRTDDLGNSWTEISSGLAITQYYEIDVKDNAMFMGGTQDNGSGEADIGDYSYDDIGGGDGFAACWHTGDQTIQYISTQNKLIRRQFGSNITIWDDFDNFWNCDIDMDLIDPNYFYLSKNNELFRCHQDGPIWSFDFEDLGVSDLFGTKNVRGMAQCESEPDVMYVICSNKLLRTINLNDAMPSWTEIPIPALTNYTDVIVDPDNHQRVWITCGGYTSGEKVYYSDTGGYSWENISSGIENIPITRIEYDNLSNSGGVYIGTEIGVYYRGDFMSDFIPFGNHLPNTKVDDIEIRPGYIYVGTHGRGVWRSELYTSCEYNLTLTVANDNGNSNSPGTQIFHANNKITSTREYGGGELTNISYFANNGIRLLPGFEVKKVSRFKAEIGDCPD